MRFSLHVQLRFFTCHIRRTIIRSRSYALSMPSMQAIANEAVMSSMVLIICCSLPCSPLRDVHRISTTNTQSNVHQAQNVNISPVLVYRSSGFIYYYSILQFQYTCLFLTVRLWTATIFNTQFLITRISQQSRTRTVNMPSQLPLLRSLICFICVVTGKSS